MGVIARITQDGLLSVAGMLVEDPALVPLARFASDGTLHVRMLIEDPVLAKVEWGRDGTIRCRAFWEGGLWTPPPPPPPTPTYYLYVCFGNKFAKINPSDLSVVQILDLSSLGTLGVTSMNREGNYIYGILNTQSYSKMLVQIQIEPLSFVKTISLTDPYGNNFINLILGSSFYYIQDTVPYLLKYDRSNNQLITSTGPFNYADGWLYSGNFFYLIGQSNNTRFYIVKTNYANNYSIYYDGNTYPEYGYIKWADILNGFIYIITAYSLIKIDCRDNQLATPVITKRISHNLSLRGATIGGPPSGAIILARSDYIYVIYRNTSNQHYVRLYDHDFNFIRGAQFTSDIKIIYLIADDSAYLYILMQDKTVYKISKTDLAVTKIVTLPFTSDPKWQQNSFIIF